MSRGRNRRHRPAAPDEMQKMFSNLQAIARQVEGDYRWLYKSGYARAHRSDGQQLGDPAQLTEDMTRMVRIIMTRACEALDDAYASLQLSNSQMTQICTLIDERASAGGIDETMPTANRGEVRKAEQARSRRWERAKRDEQHGHPFPYDEITG